MRFLLLASFLLLVQPLNNIEVSTDLTNEFDNLSVEALEIKVQLAEGNAIAANNSLNIAKKTLLTLETNAKQLNKTYTEKKEEWEKLKNLDEKLQSLNDELEIVEEELTTANNTVNAIKNKQTNLPILRNELANLEQTKPTKTRNKLEKEFNTANQSYYDAIRDLAEAKKDNDQIEIDLAKTEFDDAQKAFKLAEKELNKLIDYEQKKPELDRQIQELEKLGDDPQPFENRFIELEESKHLIEQKKNDTIAAIGQKTVQDAKKQMKRSEKAKNNANDEVTKQKDEVDKLQNTFNEAEGQVRELKQIIEKKSQNGDVKPAGFRWWIIIIVVALVAIIIVAVVLYIVRSKRQKAAQKEQETTHAVPTTVSKSEVPQANNSKSEEKWIENRQLEGSELNPSPHCIKYVNMIAQTEYDVDKLPADTPDPIRKTVKKHALLGTKVRKRRMGRKIVYKKNKVPQYDEIVVTEYTCKCGLFCRIDKDNFHKCDFNVEQITIAGVLNLKLEYPPNCNHANRFERAPALPKLEVIQYDITKTNVKFYGTKLDKIGDRLAIDVLKEAENNEESARDGGGREDSESDRAERPKTRKKRDDEYPENKPEYIAKAKMERDNFDQDHDKHISELSKFKYFKDANSHYPFTHSFLTLVCEKVLEIFKKEKHVIEISHPVVIVGDIHGEYYVLQRIFASKAEGDQPGWTTRRWLFMGDYVDRGKQALEVIIFLFLLKIKNPNSIVLLRGNHESRPVNSSQERSFMDELFRRLQGEVPKEKIMELYELFNKVFDHMSLSCLISGSILCMHGGISPSMKSLEDINNLPKPLTFSTVLKMSADLQFATDILWSDPYLKLIRNGLTEKAVRWAANVIRGAGKFFGEEELDEVQTALKLLMIIRGHQAMMNGGCHAFGHKLLSLFSCHTSLNNMVAVTELDEHGRFSRNYFYESKDEKLTINEIDKIIAEFRQHFALYSHVNLDFTTDELMKLKLAGQQFQASSPKSRSRSISPQSSNEMARRGH